MGTNTNPKIAITNLKSFVPSWPDFVFLITFLDGIYSVQNQLQSSDCLFGLFKLENVQPCVTCITTESWLRFKGGVCPARRVGIAADEGSRTTVWKMVGILDRDSLAHCLDGSNGFVERDNCATIHPHVMSGLGDGTATCTCVGSYNDIEIWVLGGKGQRLKVSGSYTSEGFPIEKYAGLSEEKVLPFLAVKPKAIELMCSHIEIIYRRFKTSFYTFIFYTYWPWLQQVTTDFFSRVRLSHLISNYSNISQKGKENEVGWQHDK